ncbi:hypothetical protein D6C83_06368 [Aureobasidium pullulans]|uniref:Uncharacterized protein n=1 Tax=Aureobasidium pullulans TaxID=5580 RepID=A0A4T0BYG3_AURPU|nr:hypothetical protein D6C83_06368 [Aureobasidium pullulans]
MTPRDALQRRHGWSPDDKLWEIIEPIYPRPPSKGTTTDWQVCTYFQYFRWVFRRGFLFIGEQDRAGLPAPVWYKCTTNESGKVVGSCYNLADEGAPRSNHNVGEITRWWGPLERLLQAPKLLDTDELDRYLKELWHLVRAFPCMQGDFINSIEVMMIPAGPWKLPMSAIERTLGIELPESLKTHDDDGTILYAEDMLPEEATKCGLSLKPNPNRYITDDESSIDARNSDRADVLVSGSSPRSATKTIISLPRAADEHTEVTGLAERPQFSESEAQQETHSIMDTNGRTLARLTRSQFKQLEMVLLAPPGVFDGAMSVIHARYPELKPRSA